MTLDRKIRVMIVDDEPLARHGLREVLSAEDDLEIIAECADGNEAVAAFVKKRPDVIFLDIQMPEKDGFDVVRMIPPEELPFIVFVTAYNEFALKAFTANALDYVLKPFDNERIHVTLKRVREMVRLKQQAGYSERILNAVKSFAPKVSYLLRIPIRLAGKITLVKTDDVVWIEAAADYIHIHTATEKFITREAIGEMELQLDPAMFVRIHRSSIVNLRHITEVQSNHHGDYTALLDNGTSLPVGRNYKENLTRLIE